MAAVAPPADPADLLKNLSLDTQTKALEVSEPAKKGTMGMVKVSLLTGRLRR